MNKEEYDNIVVDKSKLIIKKILDELVDWSLTDDVYGFCELCVQSELELCREQNTDLNLELVEDCVREYLFNHDYLEYRVLLEGDVEYSYDNVNDVLYVKLSAGDMGVYDETLSLDGLLVDVTDKGIVRGIEILDASEFLYLDKDSLSGVDSVVVSVLYGRGVVCLNLALFYGGVMRQRWCRFVNGSGLSGEFFVFNGL